MQLCKLKLFVLNCICCNLFNKFTSSKGTKEIYKRESLHSFPFSLFVTKSFDVFMNHSINECTNKNNS